MEQLVSNVMSLDYPLKIRKYIVERMFDIINVTVPQFFKREFVSYLEDHYDHVCVAGMDDDLHKLTINAFYYVLREIQEKKYTSHKTVYMIFTREYKRNLHLLRLQYMMLNEKK